MNEFKLKIVLAFFITLIFSPFSFSQNKKTLIPFKKAEFWGFADINGNIKIKPQFDSVDFFDRNSFSKVSKNKLTGYINKRGEIIVPIKFNYIKPISKDLFIVQKENKYGIMDKHGNYILNLKFEEIKKLDSKFYLVKKKKLFGIYKLENKEFKPFIKPSYEKIDYIDYKNKFICLKKNKEDVYNLEGQLIEKRNVKNEPVAYEFEEPEVTTEIIESPSNPKVKKKQKRLVIENKTKEEVSRKETIYPEYDSINLKHLFSNCIVVKQNNKWGAIDKKGKTIIDIEYSDIDIKSMSFQNFRTKPYRQIFIVKKNNKWGLIGNTNKFRESVNKNEVLIPFKYDSIRRNVNGSFFIVKSGKKYGVILSKNLKLITKLKYKHIKDTYNKVDGFILINVIDDKGNRLFVGQNGVEFFDE